MVGFNQTNYTGSEGETLVICVEILSPNATVLSMSNVRGTFNITGTGGMLTFILCGCMITKYSNKNA